MVSSGFPFESTKIIGSKCGLRTWVFSSGTANTVRFSGAGAGLAGDFAGSGLGLGGLGVIFGESYQGA